MVAKSGTARLAHRAGVAITPVGLWGTHRILTKGRRPHWQWGVAQTAVVGAPVVAGPDEHVKETTDRMMAAIVDCVARAREIYPAGNAGADEWWWRDPDTAGTHRRTA
jgi:1-acyl-sn-glycerol-3-phosphate acyltransferase